MRAYRMMSLEQPAQLAEVALPPPRPGELQLRIAACGLNFADLLMMRGQYQERPALPAILGMEMAGTVTALGPDTEGPAPGTRVALYHGSGGLAEAGNFPAGRAIPLPASMDFPTAAGFQIAYGTSHLALTRRARLRAGETLLVLGAAGGVGLTAVEIGKCLGARVIACARGAARLEIARAAGADHLIDSETEDLREAVKALGGADVVYDPVGGDLFTAALRATRPEGRILTIGFASGTVPPIAANHLLVKNITVIGFYWGGYLAFRPEALRDSLSELFDWHQQGILKPHVSHILPLERVEEALDLLRQRRATGKVVVTTGAA